jgi:hypothetical protein
MASQYRPAFFLYKRPTDRPTDRPFPIISVESGASPLDGTDGSTKKSPSPPSPPRRSFISFLFQHASPSAQISRRRPCSQYGSQIHLVNEIYPAGYRTPDGTPRFGLVGSLPRHPNAIFLLPSSHRRGALELVRGGRRGRPRFTARKRRARPRVFSTAAVRRRAFFCAPTEPSDQTRRTPMIGPPSRSDPVGCARQDSAPRLRYADISSAPDVDGHLPPLAGAPAQRILCVRASLGGLCRCVELSYSLAVAVAMVTCQTGNAVADTHLTAHGQGTPPVLFFRPDRFCPGVETDVLVVAPEFNFVSVLFVWFFLFLFRLTCVRRLDHTRSVICQTP